MGWVAHRGALLATPRRDRAGQGIPKQRVGTYAGGASSASTFQREACAPDQDTNMAD
jgi:hypothetical protein